MIKRDPFKRLYRGMRAGGQQWKFDRFLLLLLSTTWKKNKTVKHALAGGGVFVVCWIIQGLHLISTIDPSFIHLQFPKKSFNCLAADELIRDGRECRNRFPRKMASEGETGLGSTWTSLAPIHRLICGNKAPRCVNNLSQFMCGTALALSHELRFVKGPQLDRGTLLNYLCLCVDSPWQSLTTKRTSEAEQHAIPYSHPH